MPARIVFRRDAKDIFVVNSSKFNITDDGIISKNPALKSFLKMTLYTTII